MYTLLLACILLGGFCFSYSQNIQGFPTGTLWINNKISCFTNDSHLCVGLIAYWRFDETNLTRIDATCNGWNAQPQNNNLTNAAGIISNSVNIFSIGTGLLVTNADGTGRKIGAQSQTSPFSVSFWINNPGAWNTGNAMLSTLQSGGINGFLFYAGGSGGTMEPHFYSTTDAGVTDDLQSTNLVTIAGWSNIVYTFSGSVKKIYINGLLSQADTVTGISQGTNDLAIGNYLLFGNTTGQKSLYDETGYWIRELSQTEVTELYNMDLGTPFRHSPCKPFLPAPIITSSGTPPTCHYQAVGYTDLYFTVDGSTPNPSSIAHECDSSNCGDVDGVTGTLHITQTGTWGDSSGITIKMVGSQDGGVTVSQQLTYLTTSSCTSP